MSLFRQNTSLIENNRYMKITCVRIYQCTLSEYQ